MQYLFGDTDLAAHRLKVLAEVYAESTRAFVLASVTEKPHLAVDMGCGPGYTTHLLADVLQCDHAIGLDNIPNFIEHAQRTQTKRVSFFLHDVTRTPFPVGPGDLLYCRFLMTHLHDSTRLSDWATQLRPGGLLLIEETEEIRTHNETFAIYLNIVDAMLEQNSNVLYVGPVLDRLRDPPGLKRRTSRISRVQVPTHQAAGMFYLNMQSWKHQPFVKKNYPSSLIKELEEDLNSLSARSGKELDIEWGLRQIVLEKT